MRKHIQGVVLGHLLLPLQVLQGSIEGKFEVVLVGMHVAADEIIDGGFRVLWFGMQGIVVAERVFLDSSELFIVLSGQLQPPLVGLLMGRVVELL